MKWLLKLIVEIVLLGIVVGVAVYIIITYVLGGD
jgi:ABC-type lipoprotein release transport system permease subunit